MDPKVYGKLPTTHRRGLGDDVKTLHGRYPPPAEHRRRLQDGISWIQKVATVELGFRGALRWFEGT